VKIVDDEALLNLLVVTLLPDLFIQARIKVSEGIPLIIVIILCGLLLFMLALKAMVLILIEVLRPHRLSNQDFPIVAEALTSIKAVARLPVEANGHNLLEQATFVDDLVGLKDLISCLRLAPEGPPPILKLASDQSQLIAFAASFQV